MNVDLYIVRSGLTHSHCVHRVDNETYIDALLHNAGVRIDRHTVVEDFP